jgi:hypothetical protein
LKELTALRLAENYDLSEYSGFMHNSGEVKKFFCNAPKFGGHIKSKIEKAAKKLMSSESNTKIKKELYGS